MSWWNKYSESQIELAIANALAGGAADISATSNTQVLFNNAGAIGGDADLTWDGATFVVNSSARLGNDADGFDNQWSGGVDPTLPVDIGQFSTVPAGGLNGQYYVGYVLVVKENLTFATGQHDLNGLVIDTKFTGTGSGGYLIGIDLDANLINEGALQGGVGINAAVENFHADVVGEINGGIFRAGLSSDGTTAILTALTGHLRMEDASTATTARAFHALVQIANTGVTDLYGLQIDDLSAITVGGVKHAINYADKFIVDASGFIAGIEQTEPAAPAANGYRIFAKDTGGKTELLVRFNSGASQQLAIEP